MTRRLLAAAAAALGLLVFTSVAGATTLGVTASSPSGATEGDCQNNSIFAQESDDLSTAYIVPAGGTITQWQTYTDQDTPGASVTLVVLRPASDDATYTVVATDTETIPSPLPVDDVASFTLAQPISVAAGDTFGLYSNDSVSCLFYSGSVPAADVVFLAGSASAPTAGDHLTPTVDTSTLSVGYALNLAVTFDGPQDAGVQASTWPSSVNASGTAVLGSVVSNAGPGVSPITFVDQVPAGLQIQSAVAGLGTCRVSGQTVTCTISGLPVGQSVPVDVVVTAPVAGSYTNDVSVANVAGVTDPNSANNAASATLTVAAQQQTQQTQLTQPTQKCIVPGLRRTPLAVARRVLKDLGCRVRVAHKHSKVARGLVIGVRGKTGTYAHYRLVTLNVSSGPKHRAKKHKHTAKHERAARRELGRR